MQCPYCGSIMNEGDIFCPNCGADAAVKKSAKSNTYTEKTFQMPDTEKVLGGSLDKKTFFGLAWLFNCLSLATLSLILSIIVLCVDGNKLTKEEKRAAACFPVFAALTTIVSIVYVFALIVSIALCYLLIGFLILPIVIILFLVYMICYFIFSIIACINAFQGKIYRIPLVYKIAALFVK